jgi:hypothetical protein
MSLPQAEVVSFGYTASGGIAGSFTISSVLGTSVPFSIADALIYIPTSSVRRDLPVRREFLVSHCLFA